MKHGGYVIIFRRSVNKYSPGALIMFKALDVYRGVHIKKHYIRNLTDFLVEAYKKNERGN